eukprot:7386578-Prymnesium_polylepis.1
MSVRVLEHPRGPDSCALGCGWGGGRAAPAAASEQCRVLPHVPAPTAHRGSVRAARPRGRAAQGPRRGQGPTRGARPGRR